MNDRVKLGDWVYIKNHPHKIGQVASLPDNLGTVIVSTIDPDDYNTRYPTTDLFKEDIARIIKLAQNALKAGLTD